MTVLIDGKVCSNCCAFKSPGDFHKDKSSPTGLAYYCKECANSKSRNYHKNKTKDQGWVLARREYQRQAARSAKIRAIEYLGDRCVDCGQSYPPYVYDIHHLNGDTKLDNPSRLLRGDWSAAKAELDKCVLLCANCHRGRHYDDWGVD